MTHPTPTEYAEARYGGAHNIVAIAVRSGVLVKVPCACGDPVTQAHHDDYCRPLDVRWLCQKCHTAWHRDNSPAYLPNDLPSARPVGRPCVSDKRTMRVKMNGKEWGHCEREAARAGAKSTAAWVRERCGL